MGHSFCLSSSGIVSFSFIPERALPSANKLAGNNSGL